MSSTVAAISSPALAHPYDLSAFSGQNWSEADRTFLSTHLTEHPTNPDYCIITYDIKIELDDKETKTRKATYCVRKDTTKIYQNKSCNEIAGIFGVLILGRPLQAVCKTAFHLCIPISGIHAIVKTWNAVTKKNEDLPVEERSNRVWACTVAVLNSVLDIVKTPLCCIALLVMSAAAVVFYFFPHGDIYVMKMREISAQLENDLMWGDKSHCLAQCMQPLDTFSSIKKRARDFSYYKLNVDYGDAQPGSLEYGFKQLAAAQFIYFDKFHKDGARQCKISVQKMGCC